MKLAILIPTYNESENITVLLPAIKHQLETESNLMTTVYIIDDDSPDGTAKTADQLRHNLQARNFDVVVLRKNNKQGLGKAYIYGIRKALLDNQEAIIQMDADLSHNPTYLPAMLEGARHSDFVIGSRYIAGGAAPSWKLHRRLLSRGGNLYTRFFLGSSVSDYTGGFNLYKTKLLEMIDVGTLQTRGYGFQIELKFRALQLSSAVKEIPIIFVDRTQGRSKIPKSTLLNGFLLVPRLKLRSIRQR